MSLRDPTTPLVMVFVETPYPHRAPHPLVAALGEDRTRDVYRAMVERQLRALPRDWTVEINYAPAEAEPEIRRWLGSTYSYRAQPAGDVGVRLRKAFGAAFARRFSQVIAIHGDCPELDSASFEETASRLSRAELVLGPTTDGGCCLLALRHPSPELFDNIPWGSPETLAVTLARARMLGLSRELLTAREAVNDAPSYRRYVTRVAQDSSGDRLAIVVATADDASTVGRTLAGAAQSFPAAALIVADGGSRDRTREIATRHGAHVIVTRGERSRRFRAGAALARDADWLLFLLAGTGLPGNAGTVVSDWIAQPRAQVATFRLCIEDPNPLVRAAGWLTRFDTVFTRFVRQGILIRREFYDALGGFPDWPRYEDVALLRRARRATRVHALPAAVTAPPPRDPTEPRWPDRWDRARRLLRHVCGTPASELPPKPRAQPARPDANAGAEFARAPESVR